MDRLNFKKYLNILLAEGGYPTATDNRWQWTMIWVICSFYKGKHSFFKGILQSHVEDKIILEGILKKINLKNVIFLKIFIFNSCIKQENIFIFLEM